MSCTPSSTTFYSFNAWEHFKTWTPRAIVAGIGGYYGLGWAYEWGIMARIDRIFIHILKSVVGYAGIGAWMPTLQWHAAWVVRVVIAFSCGVLYDLIERALLALYNRCLLYSGQARPPC